MFARLVPSPGSLHEPVNQTGYPIEKRRKKYKESNDDDDEDSNCWNAEAD
jgi:hypothetical protein